MATASEIEHYNTALWLRGSKMPRLASCLGDPWDELSVPQHREWEDGSWYSAVGGLENGIDMVIQRYEGPLFK